ncbi:hypothetical protein E1H13_01335 [Nodosilinea sp. P-1105]|nr:hypothetical protein [Nodosilinea sp. P-1105]
MQTEDGTLKAVKLKTRSGASGVTSPGYQHLYSKALARYIIDQEKKGNKFFIQQPGGSIKRFSVVRNPIEPFSNRHGIVAEQA